MAVVSVVPARLHLNSTAPSSEPQEWTATLCELICQQGTQWWFSEVARPASYKPDKLIYWLSHCIQLISFSRPVSVLLYNGLAGQRRTLCPTHFHTFILLLQDFDDALQGFGRPRNGANRSGLACTGVEPYGVLGFILRNRTNRSYGLHGSWVWRLVGFRSFKIPTVM